MRSTRSFLLILSFFLALAGTPPAIGADSNSFNPTTVTVTAKSAGGGVPVGTIVAWPVASNPEDMDNWLECNGQTVSQTAFPELFAVVGARVPDYRGLFLRGHGSQASSHYGVVTHQSGGLGQLQGDAIREIQGNAIMLGGTGNDLYSGVLSTSSFDPDIVWVSSSGKTRAQFRNFEFQASKNTPTAQEIRPINRAVRYLIRSKP